MVGLQHLKVIYLVNKSYSNIFKPPNCSSKQSIHTVNQICKAFAFKITFWKKKKKVYFNNKKCIYFVIVADLIIQMVVLVTLLFFSFFFFCLELNFVMWFISGLVWLKLKLTIFKYLEENELEKYFQILGKRAIVLQWDLNIASLCMQKWLSLPLKIA